MTKVQLTLTDQEANLLGLRAKQLGYNLTRFLKFLISKEATHVVEEEKIPTFMMSEKAERNALRALKEYKEGKAIPIRSFKDLDKL